MSETFHIGGYRATRPNGNRAESYDPVAGTFTRWDPAGNVITSRPLTADEIASMAPEAEPADAETKLAAARDALAVLDVIEAPVTAADLADVLIDVKTALGG